MDESKTPEEMYYEWRQAFDESLDDNICAGKPIIPLTTDLGMMNFLAGYSAAKQQLEALKKDLQITRKRLDNAEILMGLVDDKQNT